MFLGDDVKIVPNSQKSTLPYMLSMSLLSVFARVFIGKQRNLDDGRGGGIHIYIYIYIYIYLVPPPYAHTFASQVPW